MMDKMERHQIAEDFREFYRNYYRDEVGLLAQHYPKDDRSLVVDWMDINKFDSAIASDFLRNPETIQKILEEALQLTELPVDTDFTSDTYPNAHVRVQLPRHKRKGIGQLRNLDKGTYTSIHGQIEQVTQKNERIIVAEFECNCGNTTRIPQPKDSLEEPSTCNNSGCTGKPVWTLQDDQSLTVDERRLKLTQPPDESEGTGEELVVYLQDDLAFADGDRSLMGMAGERVTVHGILKRDEKHTRGRSAKPILGSYVDAHALEFESSIAEDIDTESHREAIQEHIDSGEALSRITESIAPGIRGGERMQEVKRGIAYYLFRASRKESESGALRGDVHLALIGDPATGKTQLLDYIERVSPRCERLSGTDGTGAGLTTTAEQDEFAGGSWVLKPGLLPRASGGHAIVDEIDKMNDEGVQKLHEALETQRIYVGKAGINATIKTEAGVVIAANPKQGRFTGFDEFVEEIDLDPALFSRFDIIHTLHDIPHEEKDSEVAGATLDRWQEASTDESESSDGLVSVDTLRAWIALAQDTEPVLSDDAKQIIKDWYTDERTKDWGDDVDVIPVTARSVPAVARLAEAHARIHLRETITHQDAKAAIHKIKAVIGDIYMSDKGVPDADKLTSVASKKDSQQDRISEIVNKCGGETLTVSEVATKVKRDFDDVRSDLKTMQGSEAEQVANNRYEIKEIL
jgi:replicative DNA helicase Mcm